MRNVHVGYFLILILGATCLGFGALWVQLRQENQELKQILTETRKPPVLEPIVTETPVARTIETSPMSRLARLIIADEGVRTRPYPDSNGTPTIGVGRNLAGNGVSVAELKAIAGELDYDLLLTETHIQNGRVRIGTLDLANRIFVKPLTESDIHLLLQDDLKTTQNDAVSVFGQELWGKIAEPRKEALLDTLFALGLPRFKQFVNLISAVKVGNWNEAAAELLKSEAADEAPARFFRNYYILKNNKSLEGN